MNLKHVFYNCVKEKKCLNASLFSQCTLYCPEAQLQISGPHIPTQPHLRLLRTRLTILMAKISFNESSWLLSPSILLLFSHFTHFLFKASSWVSHAQIPQNPAREELKPGRTIFSLPNVAIHDTEISRVSQT